MNLFNIHTHNAEIVPVEGYDQKTILNTYPVHYSEAGTEVNGNIALSCGLHPWYLQNAAAELDILVSIAHNADVVAIGEAGLDKVQGADMDTQIQVFRQQIELSEQVEKPIIIHCVKAWEELIALKKEYRPVQPWIIHGYRGKPEQTKQLSDLGFQFSIGEFFNEESLQYIPTSSLFCETDTSPISILDVYQNVAAALKIDVSQLATIVEENVMRAGLYRK